MATYKVVKAVRWIGVPFFPSLSTQSGTENIAAHSVVISNGICSSVLQPFLGQGEAFYFFWCSCNKTQLTQNCQKSIAQGHSILICLVSTDFIKVNTFFLSKDSQVIVITQRRSTKILEISVTLPICMQQKQVSLQFSGEIYGNYCKTLTPT